MTTKISLACSALVLLAIGCGQEVKMIEVDPPSLNFTKKTNSDKLEAKALDIVGAEVPGITFKYHSENTMVATVTQDGVVKPAGNGSTAIVAESPTGVTGETFVKVCLPKDLICDPSDKLKLKVGTAGPIKCHVTNCRDEKIPARLDITAADDTMLLKEGDNVFIGLKVGDTSVTIKAFDDMELKVPVRVDEQVYLPGMGPDSGGGGGKRKGGGGSDDPYGGGGRFDHIIKNMKFD